MAIPTTRTFWSGTTAQCELCNLPAPAAVRCESFSGKRGKLGGTVNTVHFNVKIRELLYLAEFV